MKKELPNKIQIQLIIILILSIAIFIFSVLLLIMSYTKENTFLSPDLLLSLLKIH
ncbi:hypothetical protein HYV50_00050 [Candidatus Pacearchaeota archaeon]|nr:hypothetical protein [Candidatus Pacearchaeota archaeon]